MSGIELTKLVGIFFAFILISFIAKMLSIYTFGLVFLNIFSGSPAAFYIATIFSILATGLAIGKLINSTIHINPITHGLIIASLAGVYKALRPELYDLSFILVTVFATLNFLAIFFGLFATAKK